MSASVPYWRVKSLTHLGSAQRKPQISSLERSQPTDPLPPTVCSNCVRAGPLFVPTGPRHGLVTDQSGDTQEVESIVSAVKTQTANGLHQHDPRAQSSSAAKRRPKSRRAAGVPFQDLKRVVPLITWAGLFKAWPLGIKKKVFRQNRESVITRCAFVLVYCLPIRCVFVFSLTASRCVCLLSLSFSDLLS